MVTNVTWTGKSGKNYKFELHPLDTEFKPVSGVYVFARPIGRTSAEALYVGQTQSFYDRLNAGIHDNDGFERASRAGATHIGVMRVGYPTERLRIETDLRHGLCPRCNTQPANSLASALLHK